ncbi:hypothetical protein Q31b_35070 [Novipirellula aureliae]|uniref:Uncharacterized protein n=1 Tax=Novipirellula aureliae TaxID=2527966 RepID=A0A5C6DTY3_9BACT|nr:hypothetical protein Q31b_35070 [Novipirellula aureliae]
MCTGVAVVRFFVCLQVFRRHPVMSTVELNRITLVQVVVSIAGVTARIPAGRGLASMPTKNGIDELRSLFF